MINCWRYITDLLVFQLNGRINYRYNIGTQESIITTIVIAIVKISIIVNIIIVVIIMMGNRIFNNMILIKPILSNIRIEQTSSIMIIPRPTAIYL